MDTSPEELISKLGDMVECAICLEQFKDPRSLPCQHSFCRHCLEGLLGPEKKIRCPCCNKETLVFKDVRELPVDFRANSWLEIMSEYQKAKTTREAEAAQAEMMLPAQEAISRNEPCPICEQITTDPKNLICGHHLCGNCVEFLLPVGGNTLHCPTCSSETVILPTPNTLPSTSLALSQPDNPSDNEPLYQTLFELLGGRPPTVGGRSQRAQPSAPPDVICDGTRPAPAFPSVQSAGNTSAVNQLKFHPRCGKNAVVLPDQLMAYRKNPDVWGEAIVLTAQHLKTDQMFEIRLDKKEPKWSSSMQIGVTTHTPIEPDIPSDLHQFTSGTWYMTGSRVRHNNLTINEQYGQDLNFVQAGDRVGVQRKSDGTLHFYINGVDQGVAASFVPAAVYGIVDLFGKAEHVTILQNHVNTAFKRPLPPPPSARPTPQSLYPDLTAMSLTSQHASVIPPKVSVTSSQSVVTPQQAHATQENASALSQQNVSHRASVDPTPHQVAQEEVYATLQEVSVTPQALATSQQAFATPQKTVEGMTMAQMLSMLELLTKAVSESQEENVAETEYSSIANTPRSTLPSSRDPLPTVPSPPGPRIPSRPAPVVPPKSSQPERQTPPPVPTTPRPSGLRKEKPQERPPSPPTSARRPQERPPSPPTSARPINKSRAGVPTPPSPGSPCPPSQVGCRGPPHHPPARTRPVFPPSTEESSAPPTPVRSTSITQADKSPTGSRRSQDMSTTSASSKGPNQGPRVSLTDVLNKKLSLKKIVKL